MTAVAGFKALLSFPTAGFCAFGVTLDPSDLRLVEIGFFFGNLVTVGEVAGAGLCFFAALPNVDACNSFVLLRSSRL